MCSYAAQLVFTLMHLFGVLFCVLHIMRMYFLMGLHILLSHRAHGYFANGNVLIHTAPRLKMLLSLCRWDFSD